MGITSATRQKPSGAGKSPKAATAQPHLPQGTGRQRAATQGTDLQRERILQAAAQLFAAQGYANTTMAQIVRALGVTKPFVYYYFRDKQEIFETLSWRPAVDCFTALDFAAGDPRQWRTVELHGLSPGMVVGQFFACSPITRPASFVSSATTSSGERRPFGRYQL